MKQLFLLFFVLFFLSMASARTLLFLGDSYTIGTGLPRKDEKKAFPYQLIAELEKKNIHIDHFKIYARDGDTTKHLLGVLNSKEPQSSPDSPEHTVGNYDLVILCIGINDIFRGHSEADYAHHFKELLERAISFSHGDASKVIVLSIPPWDVSPSVFDQSGTKFRAIKYAQVRNNTNEITLPISAIKINQEGSVTLLMSAAEIKKKIKMAERYNQQRGIAETINAFNKLQKNVIAIENKQHQHKKINYLDITTLTRKISLLDNQHLLAPNKKMFSDDGIHYSPIIYKKWADLILPSAERLLKK